jgi:hypothetical protein
MRRIGIVADSLCVDVSIDKGVAAVMLFRLLRRLSMDSVEHAVDVLNENDLDISQYIAEIVGAFKENQ